jgi:hypothetical protein
MTSATLPLKLAMVAIALAGCKNTSRVSSVVEKTPDLVGTLPQGCAIAATFDSSASSPVRNALKAILASGNLRGMSNTVLDLQKDVTRVRYCKVSDTASGNASFILALSGNVPAGVADVLPADRGSVETDTIGKVSIVGHNGLWAARRGLSVSGDLLLASDRNLLRAALEGSPGVYDLDFSTPFSAFVAGSELSSARPGTNEQPSSLEAVREMKVVLSPDTAFIQVRLILNNQAVSERLAKDISPILSALVRRLTGAGRPVPDVIVTNTGGDIVARVELPPGSLEALTTGIAKRRALAEDSRRSP